MYSDVINIERTSAHTCIGGKRGKKKLRCKPSQERRAGGEEGREKEEGRVRGRKGRVGGEEGWERKRKHHGNAVAYTTQKTKVCAIHCNIVFMILFPLAFAVFVVRQDLKSL